MCLRYSQPLIWLFLPRLLGVEQLPQTADLRHADAGLPVDGDVVAVILPPHLHHVFVIGEPQAVLLSVGRGVQLALGNVDDVGLLFGSQGGRVHGY